MGGEKWCKMQYGVRAYNKKYPRHLLVMERDDLEMVVEACEGRYDNLMDGLRVFHESRVGAVICSFVSVTEVCAAL